MGSDRLGIAVQRLSLACFLRFPTLEKGFKHWAHLGFIFKIWNQKYSCTLGKYWAFPAGSFRNLTRNQKYAE